MDPGFNIILSKFGVGWVYMKVVRLSGIIAVGIGLGGEVIVW